jgi:hypothetical protein
MKSLGYWKKFTHSMSASQKNTISSGIVSFQVNTIVAEIDDGNPLLLIPLGSQSSSVLLSQDAGSSIQDIREKDSTSPLELVATPPSNQHPDKNKVE